MNIFIPVDGERTWSVLTANDSSWVDRDMSLGAG